MPWLKEITDSIEAAYGEDLSKLEGKNKFQCTLYFHNSTIFKDRLTEVQSDEVAPVPWKSYKAVITKSSGSPELDKKLLSLVQKGSPIKHFAPFLCGYRYPVNITFDDHSVNARFGLKSELMDSYFLKPKQQ